MSIPVMASTNPPVSFFKYLQLYMMTNFCVDHSAVSHHTGQPSSYSQFDQPYPAYNDPYNTQQQQNQAPVPGAYPPHAQEQDYRYTPPGGYTPATGYDAAGGYAHHEQQPYAPPVTTSPAPYGNPYDGNHSGYSQPFAAPTRTYTPPTQQQQQQHPAFPPLNTNMANEMPEDARRGPISPRGPRSAGQGHVAPPWGQGGGGGGPMVPQESPPGYDLPPPGAGGAAPYPPEKR